MSAFKLGQRVRLVRSLKNNGLEGTIVEFCDFPVGTPTMRGETTFRSNCLVRYDGDSYDCFENTDRLEPILYDGNQLVSWESCLWQPEGQAA